MSVKKIGKAKADIETGLWDVLQKPDQFIMNQRLVDRRPDVKAMKLAYARHSAQKPPVKKRGDRREAYYEQQKNLKAELMTLLEKVYAEILKGSFTYPVPLRKDKDTDHRSDWRYCLYQGIIYQFDRPDYPGDQMIRQILAQSYSQPAKASEKRDEL